MDRKVIWAISQTLGVEVNAHYEKHVGHWEKKNPKYTQVKTMLNQWSNFLHTENAQAHDAAKYLTQ